jgi:hypothetical protein
VARQGLTGRNRPASLPILSGAAGNVVHMEEPDVLLMLSGVSRPCPDCADDRVFVPADDADAPGAYCCTDCGAALLIEVEFDAGEERVIRVA